MSEFADRPPRETLTNASAAHARIRADIVCMRLRPGEKLRLEGLKSKYGYGLAPLREALSRLTSEGLVEFTDQRGFKVGKLSLQDLREVTFLRQELECLALRLAIKRGDDQWEGEVV